MSKEIETESNGPVYAGLGGLVVGGCGAGILWFGYHIHAVWAIVPGALLCIFAAFWAIKNLG